MIIILYATKVSPSTTPFNIIVVELTIVLGLIGLRLCDVYINSSTVVERAILEKHKLYVG